MAQRHGMGGMMTDPCAKCDNREVPLITGDDWLAYLQT